MTSDKKSPPETSLGQYAGFVTRLVAWTIDRLLLIVVLSITVAVISFFANAFRVNELLGLGDDVNMVVVGVSVVLVVFLPLVYDISLWMLAGQTLGKWIMGVRVVQANGQRVAFWAAVWREIGYFLSAILFLGYLWILFDNRRQGLHDKLARTFVVYSWPEVEKPVRPIQDRMRRNRLRRRMAEEQGQQ
jgi:uncharacterized RDD family membrane protein YckC